MLRGLAGAASLVVALAGGAVACTDRSDGGPGAGPAKSSPAGTGAASSAVGATPASGPVTEADLAEVDHILRRLDAELDRLETDMAATEGEVE